MLEADNYLRGWLVYSLAAGGLLMIVWYWANQWFSSQVANLVKMLAAILLFMPWYSHPGVSWMAPALVTCLFDMFTQSFSAGARTGIPLLIVCLAGLVLLLLEVQFRRRRQRENSSQN